MNLHFIHSTLFGLPAWMVGLFACSIPIIIHLLFRRRFKKIKWAAMRFLLAANRNTKTSLLLENILLLLLRILLLALLVAVFARPEARVTPLFSSGTQASEHFILLLDNSYSMGVRGANISPFESAKKQGRAIIEKAGKKDTISLLLMNETAKEVLLFVPLGSEKKYGEILQILDETPLSDLGTNVEASIEVLKQIIEQKEYPNKHLYIITDCQKKPWEKACKKTAFMQAMQEIRERCLAMTIVDVGIPEPENLGIVSLEAEGVVGVGSESRFVATIRNYGAKSYTDLPVDFYVDGKKQKTDYVSLMPRQESEVSFFPTFVNKGSHYVTAELSADPLLNDNKRYASFDVLDQIKVLAIDGEPKDGPFESETDYLMAAIGNSAKSLIKTTKVNLADFPPEMKFKDHDVVILANIQGFQDDKRFQELESFVEKGGGLFVWLGEKVDASYYNQEMFKAGRELLPAELKGKPIGDVGKKEEQVYSFDDISSHRVWRYFHLNQRLMEDLKRCFIYRFIPVEVVSNDPKVTVLATYTDPKKRPALMERRFGRGKVILATTTLDREWNNFHTDQYGHIFVIMLHEFIQYLVSRPAEENNIIVGFPWIKRYEFFIQEAIITSPEGTATKQSAQSLEKGAAYQVHYTNTAKSGIYSVDLTVPAQIKEEKLDLETKEYFSVNVDTEEGDVTCMNRQEFLQYFKNIEFQYEKELTSKQKDKPDKKDVEYWQEILTLLLIFTIVESLLATWFGRYK